VFVWHGQVSATVGRLWAALGTTPTPIRVLRDDLASDAPDGLCVPSGAELERLLLAAPGLRVDFSGTPTLYSRVDVAQTGLRAGAGASGWRSFLVGNTAYPGGSTGFSPLSKCVNDAEDMGGLLATKGHSVTMVLNATRAQLSSAFSVFVSTLPSDCTVVLFFSGHGCAVDGCNYVVPVDGDAANVEGALAETSVFPGGKTLWTAASPPFHALLCGVRRYLRVAEQHATAGVRPCDQRDLDRPAGRLSRSHASVDRGACAGPVPQPRVSAC
jgi:hypothetical protein